MCCIGCLDLRNSYLNRSLARRGFISHFLYHVYRQLSCVVENYGYLIGSVYIDALSYAVHITLLCPSIPGLNEKLVLYCEYVK